jgi:hypothetical protein
MHISIDLDRFFQINYVVYTKVRILVFIGRREGFEKEHRKDVL